MTLSSPRGYRNFEACLHPGTAVLLYNTVTLWWRRTQRTRHVWDFLRHTLHLNLRINERGHKSKFLAKWEMKKLLCHVFGPPSSEPTETAEHSDGPHVHSGQAACLCPTSITRWLKTFKEKATQNKTKTLALSLWGWFFVRIAKDTENINMKIPTWSLRGMLASQG